MAKFKAAAQQGKKSETASPKVGTAAKLKVKKVAFAAAPKKGSKIMNDTVKQVEETVKAATAEATTQATEMFKDINVKAKGALAKVGDISKDAVEFSKANLEAVVESGKIAAKGAQTATQSAAELGRKNFEATTAVLKQVAAVKSPTEFFKLQGDFARSQFDSAVAEMSKSSEFYLKLAGEVFQPIQNRYSVAAEQVKARMAA
ncbi:MAG: hypothetical protein RLZZ366_1422 [Pseudomonadota bacterium]